MCAAQNDGLPMRGFVRSLSEYWSLVLAFSEEEMETLRGLLERGQHNHVPKLEIISQARLHEMEPNVSKRARGALWAPTAGNRLPL